MQSSTAYQVSKFEMGVYANGRWKCGCGDAAKWLTSRTDATNGQRQRHKVARCPNDGEDDCRFFLWEKDEPEARAAASNTSPDVPPTPRTPPPPAAAANRRSVNTFFQPSLPPTPDSRDRATGRGAMMLRSPDTSPTPKRYQDARVISGDGEAGFAEDVLALLLAENIQIKPSFEVRLRHVINMRVRVHETKLQMYEETVVELSKKLAEAESGGSAHG